ncbi:hypothetical protein N0V93_007586 [Gnomoniopsis smithogilvyi]|uniref:3-hydroxyacyl-CoA dehydrogenase n=1 Tax=Gnomoniopsis smithogilvyi TaxID=1191159 RepID=A0A9W8YQD6_9PEZI|nr:hypothetical protein N0V93_007586 [Gnomoniopsis smithogilvyi]
MTPWKAPEDYRSRPVAILGGGVLGRRIATCWIAAGYKVQVRDPDVSQREACEAYAKENVQNYSAAKDSHAELGQLTTHAELQDAVRDAWLVVECVPEKLHIKIDTFAELEKLAPSDSILASNSSSYKSSEMLQKVESDDTKARILNTHYYMPPRNMLVELMTDGFTDPAIIDFMVERQRDAGTQPYVARKESTGFIYNRIWAALKREILLTIEEGVSTPQEIDSMFTTMFRIPIDMGPCNMMDGVGLDTVANIEEHYVTERGLPTHTVEWLRKEYVDQGKLGSKSKKGGLFAPAEFRPV